MMCTRCKTLMYPNPSSKAKGIQAQRAPGGAENHKKLMCSDGAPIEANKLVKEVPPWPQPSGIFSLGTHFAVMPFLHAIQDLYQAVVQDEVTPPDLNVEMQASLFRTCSRLGPTSRKRVAASSSGYSRDSNLSMKTRSRHFLLSRIPNASCALTASRLKM